MQRIFILLIFSICARQGFAQVNCTDISIPKHYDLLVAYDQEAIDHFGGVTAARKEITEKMDDAVERLNNLFQFYNLTFEVVFFPDNVYPNNLSHDGVNNSISSDFYTVPTHGIVFFGGDQSANGTTQGKITLLNPAASGSAVIMHEIGHQIFGAGHTNNGPCGYACTSDWMTSNFMCNTGVGESFTTCQSNFLVNTWFPTKCTSLMRHIEPLKPEYESPDKPEVSLSVDKKFLIRGCDKNRTDIMVNLTVVGGEDIPADVVVRAKFSERYYDFDLAGMGMDFNSVHEISPATEQNEIRILQTPGGPWNGAEMHFTVNPGESRTFMFKLKYNPTDSTEFISSGIGGLRIDAEALFTISEPGLPVQTFTVNREVSPKPIMPLQNGAAFIPNGTPVIITSNFDVPSIGPFPWTSPLALITKDVSINVSSGDELVFENSAFTAVLEGCGGLWGGINISNGGKSTIKKAVIMDAVNAVSIGASAGLVKVTNTRFENNETGINITGDGSGPVSPELSGLHFIQTSLLKRKSTVQVPFPNQISLAGIKSIDGPSLLVNPHPDLMYSAKFEGISKGFDLDNTDLSISTAIFIDLVGNYVKTGTGVLSKDSDLSIGESSFSACRAGVIASGGTILVGKSYFTEIDSAISTINSVLLATENNITSAKSGIGSKAGFSEAFKNHFNTVKSGITVFDCTLKAEENTMEGTVNGIKGAFGNNFTIRKNVIQAKDYGISFFHQNALYGVCTIEENSITMEGNVDGIALNTSGTSFFPHAGGLILNNTINLKDGQAGISANSANLLDIIGNHVSLAENEGASYGIRLQDNDQLNVTDNDVTGEGANDANQQRGIYGMHTCRSLIACNGTDNTAYGFNFAGECSGKKALAFQQNVINNHSVGLLLGLPPNNGNAVIGPQSHHRNKWSGSYSGPGALHLNPTLSILSIFKSDDLADGDYIPDNFIPSQWFINEPEQDVPLYCNRRPEGEDGHDEQIADGSVNGTADGGALQWLAQRRLYERVGFEEGGTTNSTIIYGFMQAADNNELSSYGAAHEAVRQVFSVGASDKQALDDTDAALSDNLSALSVLHKQLFTSTITATLQQIMADIDEKRNKSAQRFAVKKTLSDSLKHIIAAGAQNTIPDIEELTGADAYMVNERAMMSVLLDVLGSYATTLSLPQSEALETIAGQCPLTGGDAVLVARALLGAFEDSPIRYADDTACNPEPEERSSETKKSEFKIFPNPAGSSITIEHPRQTDTLILRDVFGKICLQISLSETNVTEIPIQYLTNGVYIYHLGSGTSGKFLVQH